MMSMQNMGLKLFTKHLKGFVGVAGGMLRNSVVTKEQLLIGIRKFGDKRGPNAGKKVGPAGKVLIVDVDCGFAASVIKKGADKPGAESGNPIWCFTNELSYGAFEGRYSKGGKHLTAASSAGKFTMMYGIDPTKMAAHHVLGKNVFRRIYLIHPRYTDWVKLIKEEQEAEDAIAAGAPKKKKAPEKALEEEMKEQEDTGVIKKNEAHLRSLMMNAVKMMDQDSRLILLHPTMLPYSKWDLYNITDNCNLEYESWTPFAKAMYPGFEPRRAGTDLKLKLESSAFYWFKLKRD